MAYTLDGDGRVTPVLAAALLRLSLLPWARHLWWHHVMERRWPSHTRDLHHGQSHVMCARRVRASTSLCEVMGYRTACLRSCMIILSVGFLCITWSQPYPAGFTASCNGRADTT